MAKTLRPALLVGLTGGIGSGKSEVGRLFEELGIRVVDADQVAREVVEPGQPALARIVEHFGPEVLVSDQTLNRRRLRDIVFAQPSEREWLEALLHPLINTEIQSQLAEAASPYALLMSPLLLETGQDEWVDRVLVVDAPEAVQLARVSRRDGVAEEQIEAIMTRQMGRDERLARADDVIENHQGLEHLPPLVHKLDTLYRTLAKPPVD